jgi:cellulose biosynthesis protein BcsQ
LQIKNTDNIKVYEDVNNKMKLSSILNKNTLGMIENKKLDFFKKYSNILENLKFQSLKKWIYNNYSYNELQFLLITQSQTSSSCQNYDYVIIDSNNYSNDITIKNKVDLKLFFFDIIFTKSSLYKNKCNTIINYNQDVIYCIDAINMVSY